MKPHEPSQWRVFLWNLGWWLPWIPERLKRRLFRQITPETRKPPPPE